ncbi:DivIVA domain-containing protein [Planomonospora corallina]|uniref:Cell wall synthesis protein Wag31 n=1 Tax=Planomonospora corallina TaxID=1806052 RepID=A0ABV8I3T0_9ACTN
MNRFPRVLGVRYGYDPDQVDALIRRIEGTLGRGEPVGEPITADEIRDARFRTKLGGYNETAVDYALDAFIVAVETLTAGTHRAEPAAVEAPGAGTPQTPAAAGPWNGAGNEAGNGAGNGHAPADPRPAAPPAPPAPPAAAVPPAAHVPPAAQDAHVPLVSQTPPTGPDRPVHAPPGPDVRVAPAPDLLSGPAAPDPAPVHAPPGPDVRVAPAPDVTQGPVPDAPSVPDVESGAGTGPAPAGPVREDRPVPEDRPETGPVVGAVPASAEPAAGAVPVSAEPVTDVRPVVETPAVPGAPSAPDADPHPAEAAAATVPLAPAAQGPVPPAPPAPAAQGPVPTAPSEPAQAAPARSVPWPTPPASIPGPVPLRLPDYRPVAQERAAPPAAEEEAARVERVAFRPGRLGMGYDEEEVDVFLDRVAATLRGTAEDPVTPADVREARFSTVIFRPGYSVSQVDAFLNDMAEVLERHLGG